MREYGFHRRVFSRIFACFSQSKLLNMYDIDVPSHVCNLRIGERLFPHSLHVNDKVQPILNKKVRGNQVRGNVGKASEEKSNSLYHKGTEQSSYDKIYD